MYEARQNKEKVSRRIDGGGMTRQMVKIGDKRNILEKEIHSTFQGMNTMQGKWTIGNKKNEILNNYSIAKQAWEQAEGYVNGFSDKYNNYSRCFSKLEDNLLHKSTKALTHAGEAYEPCHWEVNEKNIIGPGGTWGSDLMIYYNNYQDKLIGEVKSAKDYSSLTGRISEILFYSNITRRIVHYDEYIPVEYLYSETEADKIIGETNVRLFKIEVFDKRNNPRGTLIVDNQSYYLNKTDNRLYR